MKLSEKLRLLMTNPGMSQAYFNWCFHRLCGSKPRRSVDTSQPDVSVGEWISFSEYWSFRNNFSASERRFMLEHLDHQVPATVFDIGANVGVFTCWLGRLGVKVHAFEPIPETFCRLSNNVVFNKLSQNVILNCMAVGDKSGIVQFEVRDDSPATNRIATKGAQGARNVCCTTVDEYAEICGLEKIDVVKIDVEGMEPKVLSGASKMMKRSAIGAMLVEVCPWNLRHVGMSPTLLHETIIENGYETFAINEDGRPGARLAAADLEAMELENIAVLPKA